jgi:hypothetical protein
VRLADPPAAEPSDRDLVVDNRRAGQNLHSAPRSRRVRQAASLTAHSPQCAICLASAFHRSIKARLCREPGFRAIQVGCSVERGGVVEEEGA